jgi:DNA-directed RNA polymerase subunit alpha
MSYNIVLPSKPKIIKEEQMHGIFEIDGLYPGYGHTLGNSLRRVILSSIPGVAITSVAIDGVKHEFSTIEGVKEDVISIILNLKKVKFMMHDSEPLSLSIKTKGAKVITSADITCPSQGEVVNKDQYLFEVTTNKEISIEFTIEQGLGYIPREMIAKNKAEIGNIVLDASFTPIRRVSYEVENMRVGDRTDYNKLRLNIETDGSISAKDAFESSIKTMINQLQSIVGFREFSVVETNDVVSESKTSEGDSEVKITDESDENITDISKMSVEDIGLSTRTVNTLIAGSVKTVGGLTRKSAEALNELDGMGDKGITEITEALGKLGLALK